MKINALKWYKNKMRSLIDNCEYVNEIMIYLTENNGIKSEENLTWLFNEYDEQLYDVPEVIDKHVFTNNGILHYIKICVNEKEMPE